MPLTCNWDHEEHPAVTQAWLDRSAARTSIIVALQQKLLDYTLPLPEFERRTVELKRRVKELEVRVADGEFPL